MSNVRDRFARELETYAAHLAAWLDGSQTGGSHEGKWVSILGTDFVGPFDGYVDAWRAGIDRFGRPGFMVERIAREARIYSMSHVRWKAKEA